MVRVGEVWPKRTIIKQGSTHRIDCPRPIGQENLLGPASALGRRIAEKEIES